MKEKGREGGVEDDKGAEGWGVRVHVRRMVRMGR